MNLGVELGQTCLQRGLLADNLGASCGLVAQVLLRCLQLGVELCECCARLGGLVFDGSSRAFFVEHHLLEGAHLDAQAFDLLILRGHLRFERIELIEQLGWRLLWWWGGLGG